MTHEDNGKLNTGPIGLVLHGLSRSELATLAESCGFLLPKGANKAKIIKALIPDPWISERIWLNVVPPEDLVGTAEAAALLGVERPRIGRWINRGEMPMPVVKLASGPVWRRDDILAMREGVESRKRLHRMSTGPVP